MHSAITSSPVAVDIEVGRNAHPQQVSVNNRIYDWPKAPVVVVCIDGAEPDYINAALAGGLLPNIGKMMENGFARVVSGAMPSFTNPNNISIVTGAPPCVHGISGNYFLNPETGEEVMMNDPVFLRAETILSKFSENGAKVAAVTAKDKLSKMLAHRVQNGITFSAEKADRCSKPENGIDNCLEYVGRPLPEVYSGDLSLFVLEAGVKILERERPDIMYLSLTDYIQHKYAPGTKEADGFYHAVDNAVGKLLSSGAVLALTGDHGMNDKSGSDGTPNVIYLQDKLDKELGSSQTKVILPITDPYVAHHGSLGSFATVYVSGQISAGRTAEEIEKLPGIELVLDRKTAATRFELPADRIGDLVIVCDKETVLGTRQSEHDLSRLGGMRLRSHGGLADRSMYLMVSRPLNDEYVRISGSRPLHNYDAFEFALNGVW